MNTIPPIPLSVALTCYETGRYDVVNATDVQSVIVAAAKLYLAEHPADGGEPVTAEWVKAMLPATAKHGKSAKHAGIYGRINWIQYVARDEHYGLWLNGEWLNWKIMSKGAFRRLCVALGVPLAEGGAA